MSRTLFRQAVRTSLLPPQSRNFAAGDSLELKIGRPFLAHHIDPPSETVTTSKVAATPRCHERCPWMRLRERKRGSVISARRSRAPRLPHCLRPDPRRCASR